MHRITAAVLSAALLLGISSCDKKSGPSVSGEQQKVPTCIAAYTSGVISRESPVRVRFAERIADSATINVSLDKSPLSFSPSISGAAVWSDERTLEFRPKERLAQGKEYVATVKLAGLIKGESDMPDKFEFKFATMKQTYDVLVEGVYAVSDRDLTRQEIRGSVVTADVDDAEAAEKVLSATQSGRRLAVRWSHAPDRRQHTFTIDSVTRSDNESTVKLSWSGASLAVDKTGDREITIPPLGAFNVTQIRAIQAGAEHLEIQFSDPLKQGQDLRGLVRVDGHASLRFTLESNVLKVYSSNPWRGTVVVRVDRGIANVMGRKLERAAQERVMFEEFKPQVKFSGSGVILPTTQGLTVPIEAVNLRAVRVEALQVYEKNVAQFLQVNTLEGGSEMNRVGRVVWSKTVPLDLAPNQFNSWVRFGLDLSPLVQKFPGGFYRLKLTFTQRDIVYRCSGSSTGAAQDTVEEGMASAEGADENENSYWESYDYDWSEYYNNRENPCHPAYYRPFGGHDITVTRNVLISDIGLVVKRGTDDTVFVAASDLRTARPLAGASISLLDYQQGLLAESKTDKDGVVRLTQSSNRRAFAVIASNGTQSGYVRLQDGEALSVSHFDVSGENVRKGIKGFIYGERGVWRPGDSLYVTFVVFDKSRSLPSQHPIRFELRNARGQTAYTATRTQSSNGFYCFRIPTGSDAPTGEWKAVARVGGLTFEKVLKVEMVMPNRLKILFALPVGVDRLTEGEMKADLGASWLHGAPGSELKADVEVSFKAGRTQFKGFEEYVFDDPVRTYETESRQVFDGRLDKNGKTTLTAQLRTSGSAPGALSATFRTRVFEPGGAFSVDMFNVPYYPYKKFVGVRLPKGDKARGMLLTDTTHNAEIVMVGPDGKPQSGRVQVKLYQIQWRWWWEKGDESLADYVESKSHRAIDSAVVTISDGRGVWPFKVKYPSWGRYLVRARDLEGGHAAGRITYIDWPGWAGRGQKEMGGGATVLTFSADKTEYQAGETVTLTIPTGREGRGLVSIESGSRVLRTEWFEAKGSDPVQFTFKAEPQFAPNVYAHVTFLQPHSQTSNDLPIRMYGVTPVKVVDPQTVLKPVVTCADVFVPEQKAEIKIKEEKGAAMTYTLAIVDEGLLGLTRYETPDPWSHFYAREALGVKTWDMYDLVAGAYGGTLERLLAIGGDDEAGDKAKKKTQRFPPMVRFYGPFELDKGKTATHTVDIPQYVGAVRVMAVAGREGAFGRGDKEVFVRKPLMVLATLPRVIGPQEQIEMPVSVFALEEKVKNVTVSVKVEGAAAIAGDARRKISFERPGDDLVTFTLLAGEKPGAVKVTVTASGGGEDAVHTIDIQVRTPGLAVTEVRSGEIAAGGSWSDSTRLAGIEGTNTAVLEVSRVLPMNMGTRLAWLIRYPHGCVEQTTSAVFPQIYLSKLLDLKADRERQTRDNVNTGIDRLRLFATPDGGFTYWPGGEQSDWAANYAGHFLVEAEKAGFAVPAAMMDQWKKYQRNRAANWSSSSKDSDALTQSYRLYTLALAGAADMGAMNRFREQTNLPSAAQWQLAAAYSLAGQKEAAEAISKKAGVSVKKYRELSGTFGSDLRDKAMILEALCLLGQNAKASAIAKEISTALCDSSFMSTQSTAYALIALARHAGLDESGGGQMSFAYSWQGAGEQTVSGKSAVSQVPLEIAGAKPLTITVRNTGSTVLYPRLITHGVPAAGQEKSASSGLKITINYLTVGGAHLNPSSMEQGSDFIAEITVRNTGSSGAYQELALTQMVAAGWEIRNTRFEGTGGGSQSAFTYQDVRDDRVFTYFDLKQGAGVTYRVMLNASYLGRFYLPMQSVSAMYDETIYAREAGQWVNVVQPGK